MTLAEAYRWIRRNAPLQPLVTAWPRCDGCGREAQVVAVVRGRFVCLDGEGCRSTAAVAPSPFPHHAGGSPC